MCWFGERSLSGRFAEVAELADAHGSGPCGSNTLWVRLPSSASVKAENEGSSFFLYDRKLRPIIQKRSARMRTRRKGRWLPKQPRLGARMCQGTFFFISQEVAPGKFLN